ncbi:hypothetical protein [Pseudanabaena sp. PCC 6802]|uniref:hypothetical protein n=1 Tax=Pseudanabaena sp. PCC 6802 TaxID=118173 RepID=UPI000347E615|nr:hypothetical protein [Pseudanabaena sp. PCC 6802]
MNTQNYEFNDSENSIFADVATKMRAVGFISMFFGSVGAVLSLFLLSQAKEPRATHQAILGIIQGGYFLLIGTWTSNAGSSFKQIVDSRGKDISNLMDAMRSLRKLYTLQYWLLALAMVVVVFAAIASFLAGLKV